MEQLKLLIAELFDLVETHGYEYVTKCLSLIRNNGNTKGSNNEGKDIFITHTIFKIATSEYKISHNSLMNDRYVRGREHCRICIVKSIKHYFPTMKEKQIGELINITRPYVNKLSSIKLSERVKEDKIAIDIINKIRETIDKEI